MMKLAILLTIALLSILAASLTYAEWETEASLEEFVRAAPIKSVQKLIVQAGDLNDKKFTWRSKNIKIDQWLARWVLPSKDGYHFPRNIFVKGFSPKITFFNAVFTWIDYDDDSALDLKTYVADNTKSVFVSTTRYTGKRKGYIWTPRNRKNAFRYDIFAPGGIDVNPTLGKHKFENQNEIAFVGGIQAKYIYGALEYTSEMRQKCYHINPNYEGKKIAKGAYPHINRKLQRIYYNSDGSVKKSVSQSWSKIKKRSATIDNQTMETDRRMNYSESTRSFCYKVTVQSISFTQPNKVDLIKPHGKINVFIQKPNFATVWDVSYNRDISQGVDKVPVRGKEVYLKADISSNPPICFDGSVHEFDQDLTDGIKQISQFTSSSCVQTQSSFPSKKYVLTSGTKDGSVKIQFKVARCGN